MPAIALLTATRPGFHDAPTDAEADALAAHLEFLRRLVADGRVLTAGPCEDGSLGVVVFPTLEANDAKALMTEDPAVVAGVLRVEVKSWRMSLLGHGTGRDWTRFVQRTRVKASTESVWRRLATPGGIASWFTSSAATTRGERRLADDETLQPGDRIRFVWRMPAPGDESAPDGSPERPTIEMPEVDEVLEVESRRRLRHAWYEGKGWVEYRIRSEPSDGRTTIELEQWMDPANDIGLLEEVYVGCREGWGFYLTNLKAVLDHGVDLRDPSERCASPEGR